MNHIAARADAIANVCVGCQIEFVVLEVGTACDKNELVGATAGAVCDEAETAEQVDVEEAGLGMK
ncbi:MAG TPA: hypothetical protein VFV48_00505 [Pseudomonadales bacterium]|nr:hypothetical protein [Pseudomonadales bacterium]